VTQRCVLGSAGIVRAFRAGATAPALGTVDPRAKFAVRRWCDERPGAVSFEDGDRVQAATRHWTYARTWLYAELGDQDQE
jgi:hypothetical protein